MERGVAGGVAGEAVLRLGLGSVRGVGEATAERKELEEGRRFRRGYRFRAGIEGRIHSLRRDFGLKRCRYHGSSGMGRWVGWGIVTHNLVKIAEAGAAR